MVYGSCNRCTRHTSAGRWSESMYRERYARAEASLAGTWAGDSATASAVATAVNSCDSNCYARCRVVGISAPTYLCM